MVDVIGELKRNLGVCLDVALLRILDEKRGLIPRSTFIESMLRIVLEPSRQVSSSDQK